MLFSDIHYLFVSMIIAGQNDYPSELFVQVLKYDLELGLRQRQHTVSFILRALRYASLTALRFSHICQFPYISNQKIARSVVCF